MKPFVYERRIHYYETDSMGVMHHANHLRLIEESRVGWIKDRGLGGFHYPHVDWHLALTESHVNYLKPILFDQLVRVELQIKRQGIRVYFRYALFSDKEHGNELLSTAETVHVFLNENLKPVKIPDELKERLEKEPWIETWPSSLSESPKKQP